MRHFSISPFTSDAALCGENGSHDTNVFSLCNSVSATECIDCKVAISKMQEIQKLRFDFSKDKFTGLLESYKCGFITLEEYMSEVETVGLLAIAKY